MKKTMKQNFDFSNLVIITGLFVGVASIGSIFSHYKTSSKHFSKNEIPQINYEMVKLENKSIDYSLSDREIDSEYLALEKKLDKKDKKIEKVDNKNLKAEKNKKSTVVDKKNTQSKSPSHEVSNQKRNQNYIQAAKKYDEFLKNQAFRKSIEATFKNEVVKSQLNGPHVVQNNTRTSSNTHQAEVNPENSQKEDLKSITQWKTEILSQQNKETILKFATAYKKGQVSAADYQSLTNELVKSEDQKIVGLGLYILRSTPSALAYSQLIKIQGQLSSEYSNYVQESLLSYNQTAYLGILKQGLVSTDKTVVLKTVSLINVGLNRIKEGSSAELVESRYRRLDQAPSFSVSNYASFLPLLQKIAADATDAELSRLALQNIDLIGTQNIAAN